MSTFVGLLLLFVPFDVAQVNDLFQQGRFDDAYELLLKMDISEADTDVLRLRGYAAWVLGDLESARDDFDRVLTLTPEDLYARRMTAFAAMEAGDLRGARREFEEVVRTTPQDQSAQEDLAFVNERIERINTTAVRPAAKG